jgi:hypothetical protein
LSSASSLTNFWQPVPWTHVESNVFNNIFFLFQKRGCCFLVLTKWYLSICLIIDANKIQSFLNYLLLSQQYYHFQLAHNLNLLHISRTLYHMNPHRVYHLWLHSTNSCRSSSTGISTLTNATLTLSLVESIDNLFTLTYRYTSVQALLSLMKSEFSLTSYLKLSS